jgi:hypothetical protein
MIEYEFDRVKIKINLNNGVYIFDGAGAEGKTYLAGCLKAFSLVIPNSEDITVLSSDNFSMDALDDGIEKSKLIMLDRADMYFNTKIAEKLNNINNLKSIIMIDLKNMCLRQKVVYDDIGINLEHNKIEVNEIQ